MPPVVCKFWQQGACRYGDRCRFEHPPLNQGIPNGNRFAVLQNQDNSNTRSSSSYQGGARNTPYSLDKDAIIADLSTERPQWILSAYGPGRQAPAQLFGGPLREQSFEEMRLMHYMALASGNAQQAVQEADKLFQASEQQMQTALSNVDEAINFIISAEKEHPNRIDICRMSTSGQGSTSTPFSQQSSTPTTQASGGGNPFGVPSQPAASSPFGNSTTASTGVFGQPSGLGQRPNPYGGTSQSFGTPSQLGAAGAFGRPSVLGQKPNPFGAPSASPASGISNTATAPFSSFAAAPNPFAQPQQQQGTNPFGAPSQPAQQNPLNQTATQISNPFGSANPPSQQQNPFGNPSSAPFGAPSSISENPFGQPSTRPPTIGGNPFGSASTSTVNPFAQRPPTQASTSNLFGATQPFAAPNANPFGNPPAANAFNANQAGGSSQPSLDGAATVGQNSSESYSSKGVDGRLKMFKGRPVVYKNDEAGFRGKDGSWQKIWFPQGAPAPYKDTEMEVSQYDESIKTAYMHLQQSGSFEGGVMPMMPPRREWCSFDF